jgi:hypothetical protein
MITLRFEDLAGAVALFLLLIGGFWVSAGAGLDTGAEQLLQEVR